MTLDPNMFTPAAASGKAELVADASNDFYTQVLAILGAVADASVSPAVTVPTVLCELSYSFADTSTTTHTIVTSDKIEIVDVIVRCDLSDSSSTVTIKDGSANAISDAIACSTNKAVTRAGTLDTSKNVIAAGGSIEIVCTKGTTKVQGNVTILAKRRA